MEEPYWRAEEGEEWAVGMYYDIPSSRKYLPSWILEAIKNEL